MFYGSQLIPNTAFLQRVSISPPMSLLCAALYRGCQALDECVRPIYFTVYI